MKKFLIKAVCFAVVFAVTFFSLFVNASAVADNGFVHMLTSNNTDCYADITIEGDHFTIEGRAVKDPVYKIMFSSDEAEMSDYEFTSDDGLSFHAEFDCSFSGDHCYLWLVQESKLVMNYLIQHDENGWSFPDNGLAALNAEKLEDIRTAAPEASAYYLSQTADSNEIEETMAELEQLVQEICGDEQDDYRKAYLLNRWIGENIYYDKDAAATEVTLDTVAVHNVLERRRTTCAGFANTYCAMLELAGIRSVNLKGAATGADVSYDDLLTVGENHEFTAFWYEAENRWAYVDPCWSSNGKYEYGEYRYDYPASDKYFDITGEAFALNHRVDKVEERDYTGALAAVTEEETEETTSQDPEAVETEDTQSTRETEADTSAAATSVTSAPAEAAQNGSYVLYIVVGAVGVVIVVTGITMWVRKKTQ